MEEVPSWPGNNSIRALATGSCSLARSMAVAVVDTLQRTEGWMDGDLS